MPFIVRVVVVRSALSNSSASLSSNLQPDKSTCTSERVCDKRENTLHWPGTMQSPPSSKSVRCEKLSSITKDSTQDTVFCLRSSAVRLLKLTRDVRTCRTPASCRLVLSILSVCSRDSLSKQRLRPIAIDVQECENTGETLQNGADILNAAFAHKGKVVPHMFARHAHCEARYQRQRTQHSAHRIRRHAQQGHVCSRLPARNTRPAKKNANAVKANKKKQKTAPNTLLHKVASFLLHLIL